MAVFFNTSRFVIDFLPRSKCLLILWLLSPLAVILETKKIKSASFHFSPSICHEVMGLDAILVCWILSFNPPFSLSFIKKLISFSLLFAIRVVSSACLRLLIFIKAILLSACDSCSLVFCIIYSGCKLNKQGDKIQLLTYSFPNFWTSPLFHVQFCCFLTCIQVSQR